MKDSGQEEHGAAVPRDDPDIERAILTAKGTLEQFVRRIESPSATQRYQAVKVKLSWGGFDEYVWIPVITFNNGKFAAAAGEYPGSPSLFVSDNLDGIGADQIYDWMIVDDGKLVGGYSIRAMRAKMDPEQQRKFDELAWYSMD